MCRACSREWAVARLREKAKADPRCNYLLRQSEKEFRSYTLVYLHPSHKDPGLVEKNPSSREPVCLQIKQMPDTGLYQLVVKDGSPVMVESVQQLVAYYRQNSTVDAGIVLQACVRPTNPCKSWSRYILYSNIYVSLIIEMLVRYFVVPSSFHSESTRGYNFDQQLRNVSTIHDDDFYGARLPVFSGDCLELTTEN